MKYFKDGLAEEVEYLSSSSEYFIYTELFVYPLL